MFHVGPVLVCLKKEKEGNKINAIKSSSVGMLGDLINDVLLSSHCWHCLTRCIHTNVELLRELQQGIKLEKQLLSACLVMR